MLFWNCTLRWVTKHRLGRWIFLNCIMFLKFHIHAIHIKASIFKILTWTKEEIVLLNKYYKVFHCPMFSWERCFNLREELLLIYWKIRAIRTLYTTWKTKYFIHVSCREKNRLARDTLAVYIWLEEISSAIQKHWNLTKMYPSYKRLNAQLFFLSAYWIFHPLYFNFLYIQKLKTIVSVLMQKILS